MMFQASPSIDAHVDQPLELIELVRVGETPHEVDRRRRQLRKRHWTMLVLAVSVVLLAFLLNVHGGDRVAFRGFSEFPLPELCGARALFNTECPGCGLTRSFLALANGDWYASLHYHHLGWLFALAVAFQIPYRIHCLRELRYRMPESRWPTWTGNFLIAALLLNWFFRLLWGQVSLH